MEVIKVKKFNIFIEEHIVEEFQVEANNLKEAIKIAKEKYKKGEFVLEPGNLVCKLISGENGEEKIEWEEF